MKTLKAISMLILAALVVVGCSGNDGPDVITGPENSEDKTPPKVSIQNPTPGAVVSGSIEITADASDSAGVTKVEFYVAGTMVGTDNSAPWKFTWGAASHSDGDYNLKAKAYDAAGNIGESQTVRVTVRKVF